LSDVIDDQNLNCEALIRHLMCMYEGIVGPNSVSNLEKITEAESLSQNEVNELQRDLGPLISIVRNEDSLYQEGQSTAKKLKTSPQKPIGHNKGI
jgi:hypothetical protein